MSRIVGALLPLLSLAWGGGVFAQEEAKVEAEAEFPEPLLTRSWMVPPNVFDLLERKEAGEEVGPIDPVTGELILEERRFFRSDVLKKLGMEFPLGFGATFDFTKNELKVINTRQHLDLLEEKLAALRPMRMFSLDQRLYARVLPAASAEEELRKEQTRTVFWKVEGIIFPEVEFDQVTIEAALGILERRSVELDPGAKEEGQRGVRIILPERTEEGEESELGKALKEEIPKLRLRRASLRTVLVYLFHDRPIRYEINHEGVIIIPEGSWKGGQMAEWRWKVDPELMVRFRTGFEIEGEDRIAPLPKLLSDGGFEIPAEGKADYSAEQGELVVRAKEAELFAIDALLQDLAVEMSRKRSLGGGRKEPGDAPADLPGR